MNKTPKIIAAGIGTLALVGGIGAGVAYADPTPSPTGSPTASPSAKPSTKAGKNGQHRTLINRALHGEVTLAGKKHRVVDFQRGTVTAVSASSVTVKSNDGFTATYVLGSTTKVREHRAAATLSDITADAHVRVVATKDGSTLTAQRVQVRTK